MPTLLPDPHGALGAELEGELERQTDQLIARIADSRERLGQLHELTAAAEQQLAADEAMLAQLQGVLGRPGQLALEHSHAQLRGRRLQEIALEILARRAEPDTDVHYRQWYGWLREAGYHVCGQDPVATFLVQISRSPAVERVGGSRSGRYRIRRDIEGQRERSISVARMTR